jgi:hypothetical protein
MHGAGASKYFFHAILMIAESAALGAKSPAEPFEGLNFESRLRAWKNC